MSCRPTPVSSCLGVQRLSAASTSSRRQPMHSSSLRVSGGRRGGACVGAGQRPTGQRWRGQGRAQPNRFRDGKGAAPMTFREPSNEHQCQGLSQALSMPAPPPCSVLASDRTAPPSPPPPLFSPRHRPRGQPAAGLQGAQQRLCARPRRRGHCPPDCAGCPGPSAGHGLCTAGLCAEAGGGGVLGPGTGIR